MLKDIINEVKNYDDSPEKKTVIDFDNNIYLNKDLFRYKIEHLADIPEDELVTLVKHSYKSILNHIYDRSDMYYIKAFSDEKFLKVLIQVLSAEPFLDPIYIKCCNKLAYDYLTYSNADPKIRSLFFTLSKVVNSNMIYSLYELHIPDELASYIILARKSTDDELVNIKRVNFLLLQQDSRTFNLEMLVRVYERLFTRAKDLFIYTITDVYDFDDEMFVQMKDESPEKFNSFYNIYIAQTDAVMTIVNSMEFNLIVNIIRSLLDYAAFRGLTSDGLRYSLRSIARTVNNYRVIQAIEYLENVEKQYIL